MKGYRYPCGCVALASVTPDPDGSFPDVPVVLHCDSDDGTPYLAPRTLRRPMVSDGGGWPRPATAADMDRIDRHFAELYRDAARLARVREGFAALLSLREG